MGLPITRSNDPDKEGHCLHKTVAPNAARQQDVENTTRLIGKGRRRLEGSLLQITSPIDRSYTTEGYNRIICI